ncbi:lysozyme [Enterobacter kobei]|uniref:lysozyme n=1 Tax=Enterobacter kobei TaxID=208224 RepID=UPI003CED5C77
MRISEKGIALIKHFESCRLVAYPDPGTGNAPWTIGWGHTGPDVTPGLMWTQAQADHTLLLDLKQFERDVLFLVKVPLTQAQFDALVSFTFNVGSDIDKDTLAEGLGDSTLLKKINASDYVGASREFLKWNKAGKKVLPGLTRRRNAEMALFLS